MIDAQDRPHPHRGRRRHAGRRRDHVGDGGPATSAHLNMPSDVAIGPNGDIYIADMHHNRVRKVDARTHDHHDRRRQRRLGQFAATTARRRRRTSPARPASRWCRKPGGTVTIFIADYYNGRVRAVGPDGIMRNVSDERQMRSARRRASPSRSSRGIAGSTSPTPSNDNVVALNIPKIAPTLRAARRRRCRRRRRGRRPDERGAPTRRATPPLLRLDAVVPPAVPRTRGAAGRAAAVCRSASARCSRGRSRSSSTTSSPATRCPSRSRPLDRGAGRHAQPLAAARARSSSPASCCRS